MYMQSATIQCQCLGCSTVFSITCKLISLKQRLLRLVSPCPKCKRALKVVVRYELLHRDNLTFSGIVATQGVKIKELKGVAYAFTCGECENCYIQKISSLTQVIDQFCMQCHTKMNLEFFAHQMNAIIPKIPVDLPVLGKKTSSKKK